MGQKLAKAYQLAKENGGLAAQMRLAMKGGMAEDKAVTAPDSPELVKKFEAALSEILGKPVSL
jgi:hypothetical protein